MLHEMYEGYFDVNKPQIQFINKVDFVWGIEVRIWELFCRIFQKMMRNGHLLEMILSSLSRKYIRDVLEKQFWKCFRRIMGKIPDNLLYAMMLFIQGIKWEIQYKDSNQLPSLI